MRHSISLPDIADLPRFSIAVGKWLVLFVSRGTDTAGVPERLLVIVDDLDASMTLVSA